MLKGVKEKLHYNLKLYLKILKLLILIIILIKYLSFIILLQQKPLLKYY